MATWKSRPLPESRRVGLDLEALPQVNWGGPPTHRHVLCVAFGVEDAVDYIECSARRPGRFYRTDLEHVVRALSAEDVIVVGHNAIRYDLPLLNGVLVQHGLAPLPKLRAQDTMNTLKTGQAYRNSLKEQCRRYGVNLKQGGPDWDRVLQQYDEEWDIMREYNKNDVVSTLQLERALSAAGIPVPVKTWDPRKR